MNETLAAIKDVVLCFTGVASLVVTASAASAVRWRARQESTTREYVAVTSEFWLKVHDVVTAVEVYATTPVPLSEATDWWRQRGQVLEGRWSRQITRFVEQNFFYQPTP